MNDAHFSGRDTLVEVHVWTARICTNTAMEISATMSDIDWYQ